MFRDLKLKEQLPHHRYVNIFRKLPEVKEKFIQPEARKYQAEDRRYHDDVHYVHKGYREHVARLHDVGLFYLHDLYRRDYVERQRKTYEEEEYRAVYRIGLRDDKIYQRYGYGIDGEEVRRQLYYKVRFVRLDRAALVRDLETLYLAAEYPRHAGMHRLVAQDIHVCRLIE